MSNITSAGKTIEIKILDEIVKIPTTKSPPVTVGDPYQAAKALRRHARQLYEVPEAMTMNRLRQLEALLGTRTSKAQRLEALRLVALAFHEYSVANRASVAQIKQLVQILPTVPNLPQTNAENILRAMVAILKSNGVIKG